MIKIKGVELFAIEGNKLIIDKINPEIEKFLNYPYKNCILKYDIQNKLGKMIIKEIMEISEFRESLFNENRDNAEEVHRKLIELLNSEITINAEPIGLSLLVKEECSGLNMAVIDRFILDDRR